MTVIVGEEPNVTELFQPLEALYVASDGENVTVPARIVPLPSTKANNRASHAKNEVEECFIAFNDVCYLLIFLVNMMFIQQRPETAQLPTTRKG
ncbi:MAG: hypothetical protein IKI05_05070 [Bacteroidaceae bacterium]|nr:hypothetical protein [Bacteroidaceae bacterium]